MRQICRVEDIHIHGNVSGSVVHIQRSRTVTVSPAGVLSASALGMLDRNLDSLYYLISCEGKYLMLHNYSTTSVAFLFVQRCFEISQTGRYLVCWVL